MSKRRDANFTKEETDKLMELVQQYLDIILNNKCTSDVNRQKEDAWNLIAEEFNSFTTNHRTAKQLKHKLENMKRRNELRELQQQILQVKLKKKAVEGEDDEHAKWVKRLQDGGGGDTDWDEADFWGDKDVDDTSTKEAPPQKKLKLQTIYVKPLPTLNCGDVGVGRKTDEELHKSGAGDGIITTTSSSKTYSSSQTTELFKLELKHKQERHRQQMEYEKKLQEAQLNKLALEARIYEAQLNKANLEVKQLTRRLQREEQLHNAKMSRESGLHTTQVDRAKADTPETPGSATPAVQENSNP